MSDTSTPAPPAANTWDVDAIADAARHRLRMNPGDDDWDLVAAEAASAVGSIDQELDRLPEDAEADPPVEVFAAGAVPYLFDAAVTLTVSLMQRSDEDAPLDPPDPVAAVRAQVRPAKARWGIA